MLDLSPEAIPLVLLFLVPGFIAMKVYGLLVPARERHWGAATIEVFSYGSLNLGLWWWLVMLVQRVEFSSRQPLVFALGTIWILVVFPVLLAILAWRLRRTRFARRWITHPLPTAWDFFFASRQPCWILFHLKNGKRFGGFFGEDSFASSFPAAPDLYVQDLWRVDEFGRFRERVPGNLGMIVRYDDCHHMQLFVEEG